MEHENIKKFISEKGYSPLTEIRVKFSDVDPEILEMNLTFLVEKNKIRKAGYHSPEGNDTLYYLPTA